MILVFTSGTGLAGAVTRFWCWSRAGHVAAELGQVGATIQYLDATPERGVAQHAGISGQIVGRFSVDCEPEQGVAALAWTAEQIGKPYDWRAVIGIGLRRDWRNPGAWFCSDLLARAFEVAGCPLVRAEALDRITPRDLMGSERLRPVSGRSFRMPVSRRAFPFQ